MIVTIRETVVTVSDSTLYTVHCSSSVLTILAKNPS